MCYTCLKIYTNLFRVDEYLEEGNDSEQWRKSKIKWRRGILHGPKMTTYWEIKTTMKSTCCLCIWGLKTNNNKPNIWFVFQSLATIAVFVIYNFVIKNQWNIYFVLCISGVCPLFLFSPKRDSWYFSQK